jgi:uncharacterized protein (DUF1786 family)
MQILTVDIGTGTQDIFLFDSQLNLENGFKLVVPSPTMMIHRKIKKATQRQEPVLLTGVTMGGGPSAWAAENHVKAGLPLYATPSAARSFDDDLEKVKETGIQIISEDEAAHFLKDICRIELRDFDLPAIACAMSQFGVSLDGLAAIAVAVFDHGNAPPDVSDRKFRFDYLDARIRQENRLSAFAYRSDEIPESMTRLCAVKKSFDADACLLPGNIPLIVMDTAPAAVLGAIFDPVLHRQPRLMIANVGNFHTLAFRLGPTGIEGIFEHHTGLLDQSSLDRLLLSLADGNLTNQEVFGDHGHGALIYHPEPLRINEMDFGIAVTGPRRSLLFSSSLRPYFAVPYGDMMIAGCFGLLAATADLMPDLCDPITEAMDQKNNGISPWEID